MIKLVISGACGKMGTRIARLALKDGAFKIVGAMEAPDNPFLGRDYGQVLHSKKLGVKVTHLLEEVVLEGEVIIEFSTPRATLAHLEDAVKAKKRMVIGTTGFTEEDRKRIERASRNIAIVFSPNMSISVNLLFKLVAEVARTLRDGYTVRISEAHHIHKKDAPSGTAKELSRIIKDVNKALPEIPIESIRRGEIVGDHRIIFESAMDSLELTHSAKTRDIFARGALVAAKFIAEKDSGLYTMKDVLPITPRRCK